MQAWNWKGIDVVNAHERDLGVNMRGLREAIEAVASGRPRSDAALHPHLPGWNVWRTLSRRRATSRMRS